MGFEPKSIGSQLVCVVLHLQIYKSNTDCQTQSLNSVLRTDTMLLQSRNYI